MMVFTSGETVNVDVKCLLKNRRGVIHGHFIVNHSINPRHDQGGVQRDGEVSSKSMATGKKYKIVLSEKYVSKSENGKEWFQFPLNISGQLVAIQTIIPLDPYTEPDMEQVRKEAYEKGLSDAWEAARKIGSNSMCSLKEMGFDFSQCAVDDYNPSWFVVKNYSASEAIEKIRQYEQEKDRQARIEYNFDEIKDVLETTAKECNVSLDEIAEVLQKMQMKDGDNE